MSESFKSVFTSARGSDQKLSVGMTSDGYLNIVVRGLDGRPMGGVALALQDAPAVMLAVAQASGVIPAHSDEWAAGEPANLARIAAGLQHHIERRDARTKEAADREALALLGRKLYNADRSACDLIWEDLSTGSKKRWIDRMGKAREIIEATK